MARKKKVETAVAPASAPAAPVVDQPESEALADARRALYTATQAHWDQEAEHYGWEDPIKPENVTRRLQAILGAMSIESAQQLATRARATIQIMLLGAWSRNQIPGPTNERTLEHRIKKAENLAAMLDKKGQAEAAQQQRDRADQLRNTLDDIRAV